jgi:hypothetical protein
MHWVAFYKEASSVLEFFDSFGLQLETYGPEFVNFAVRNGKDVSLNVHQLQPNNTSSCGQFCLYFLLNRNLGRSYEEIMSDFDLNDCEYNNMIVKSFVLQRFSFPEFHKCVTWCKKRCKRDGVDSSSVCIQFNTTCFRLT